MVESEEIIALLIATAVLAFVLGHRRDLARIPRAGVLASSYLALYAGLVATVAEGLFLQDALNILEHLCNTASAFLLTCWLWCLIRDKGKDTWPSSAR